MDGWIDKQTSANSTVTFTGLTKRKKSALPLGMLADVNQYSDLVDFNTLHVFFIPIFHCDFSYFGVLLGVLTLQDPTSNLAGLSLSLSEVRAP